MSEDFTFSPTAEPGKRFGSSETYPFLPKACARMEDEIHEREREIVRIRARLAYLRHVGTQWTGGEA